MEHGEVLKEKFVSVLLHLHQWFYQSYFWAPLNSSMARWELIIHHQSYFYFSWPGLEIRIKIISGWLYEPFCSFHIRFKLALINNFDEYTAVTFVSVIIMLLHWNSEIPYCSLIIILFSCIYDYISSSISSGNAK